jgi:hypothetical protein
MVSGMPGMEFETHGNIAPKYCASRLSGRLNPWFDTSSPTDAARVAANEAYDTLMVGCRLSRPGLLF